MITAVDTSVLIDIFGGDPVFGAVSRETMRRCRLEGRILICATVWAELSGFFDTASKFVAALGGVGAEFSPMSPDAAFTAGRNWRTYRARGGPRERVLADFLVGGHAFHHADRLLTRDTRFHETYLPKLQLVVPKPG